jgi:hypothetical protein
MVHYLYYNNRVIIIGSLWTFLFQTEFYGEKEKFPFLKSGGIVNQKNVARSFNILLRKTWPFNIKQITKYVHYIRTASLLTLTSPSRRRIFSFTMNYYEDEALLFAAHVKKKCTKWIPNMKLNIAFRKTNSLKSIFLPLRKGKDSSRVDCKIVYQIYVKIVIRFIWVKQLVKRQSELKNTKKMWKTWILTQKYFNMFIKILIQWILMIFTAVLYFLFSKSIVIFTIPLSHVKIWQKNVP